MSHEIPFSMREQLNNMTPEEQAEFLKKREEALGIADASPKVFETGSGGAVMESSETDEDEIEARRENMV